MRAQIAAAALAAAGLLSAATQASASVPRVALAAVYNSSGEAGQYVQSSPNRHFRDVRDTFQATQAQLGVSGGGTGNNGGVGLQLCSNATGQAIQFGLIPDGSVFQLAYQAGALAQHDPATTNDACATGGILPAPIVISALASYDTIPVGDTVSLEIYYNSRSGWVTLSVTDLAQGGTEEFHFRDASCGRWCDFTEPGAGVRDLAAPALSAPADIPLVTFEGLRATQYNGRHWSFSHWTTVADSFNLGGSVTDAPADLLQAGPLGGGGTTFTVLSGNPAP